MIADLLAQFFAFVDHDERVDEIYVYCGVSLSQECNCFYRIDGEIVSLPAARPALGLSELSIDESYDFMRGLTGMVDDLQRAWAEYGLSEFSEVKAVYELATDYLRVHVEYEPIDEESSCMAEFSNWHDAVRAGKPALPDETPR